MKKHFYCQFFKYEYKKMSVILENWLQFFIKIIFCLIIYFHFLAAVNWCNPEWTNKSLEKMFLVFLCSDEVISCFPNRAVFKKKWINILMESINQTNYSRLQTEQHLWVNLLDRKTTVHFHFVWWNAFVSTAWIILGNKRIDFREANSSNNHSYTWKSFSFIGNIRKICKHSALSPLLRWD